MKKAHEDHVGMKISMSNGTVGVVTKVSEKGYRIKIGIERTTLKLDEIRWSKSNKLSQIGERDFSEMICILQNCGPHIDGVMVKVHQKVSGSEEYRFMYTTGCGGSAPARCFAPVVTSKDVTVKDENTIVCDCCKKGFPHKELQLYYVPLKEWFKQGVMCCGCHTKVAPILNLVKTRPSEEEENFKKVGANLIKSLGVSELLELNNTVKTTADELATRHGLAVAETHKQVRPTAMEYTLLFKLPTDVDPATIVKESKKVAKGITAKKAAGLIKKSADGLKQMRVLGKMAKEVNDEAKKKRSRK